MTVEATEPAGRLPLDASDFSVPAEEFVQLCAKAAGLPERSPVEVELLAKAIRDGRSRLDILDILIGEVDPLDARLSRPNPKALRRDVDSFVVVDLMERYSPDDDREFARFAIKKILGETPTSDKLDTAQGQLADAGDRRAFMETLAARRLSRGYRAEISPGRIGDARLQPDGQTTFVVVRQEPGLGWAVGENVQVLVAIRQGKWAIQPGWVVIGPKQSFPSGLWRLNIHLVQPMGAVVVVDVVANSGADVLARTTLLGPAKLALGVDIKDWHHFIEVRLFKPQEPPENNALDIQDLSLIRLS